jgi:hypothetical protein
VGSATGGSEPDLLRALRDHLRAHPLPDDTANRQALRLIAHEIDRRDARVFAVAPGGTFFVGAQDDVRASHRCDDF